MYDRGGTTGLKPETLLQGHNWVRFPGQILRGLPSRTVEQGRHKITDCSAPLPLSRKQLALEVGSKQ